LSTAWVQVTGANSIVSECRVLLDSASQSNFISTKLCTALGLSMKRADFSVSGLGQTVTHIKHQVSIQIQSRCNQFKVDLSCPVIPEITGVIPSVSFDGTKLKTPKNLILADPSFLTPDKVDILIGADTFWNLISIGQIKF
jgi:hypothetical protein